jgi:integrase/recombinase XerD
LNCDTRVNRLSIVRVFSRFLHAVDPHSTVLEYIPVKRSSLPRFYLYSQTDLNALLNAALQLRPATSLRPHCFYMLIGLMVVTGLRIGEALSLDLRDLDLDHKRLFVRKGKFGKELYVVIHSSTVEQLKAYLKIRRRYGSDTPSSALFLDHASRRLCYNTARDTFATLRCTAQVGNAAIKPPRWHDLRHTYACNCLQKWRREGTDVNAKLPLLATAMGHTKIEHTQIYLHITLQQLRDASERLRDHLNNTNKGN